MDKIEEIVLNNTHVWGPAPYNKWNRFINLDSCTLQEFNAWMAGYAVWLKEKKTMMLHMINQNWNLDFSMSQRKEFAEQAWSALNGRFPNHECLRQQNTNDQLIASFNQL